MKKIIIQTTRTETTFELAKSDDFMMTETKNIIRRGNALFFILGGYVEIYESERDAKDAFRFHWNEASLAKCTTPLTASAVVANHMQD